MTDKNRIKFKVNLRTKIYLELIKATKPENNIKESKYAYMVRRYYCNLVAHTIYEQIGDQKDCLKRVKMFMPINVILVKSAVREVLKTTIKEEN